MAAATQWLGVWLSLAMQPSKIPYDSTYMIEAKHRGRVRQKLYLCLQVSSDNKLRRLQFEPRSDLTICPA